MLKQTLQNYLDRLIDLSSRNRALYLAKVEGNLSQDLHAFHFADGKPSFAYIEDLISGKKTLSLLPLADPRDKDLNQLSVKLRRLYQAIKTTEEETGEQSFYLGWPYIEGKLLNGQLIRGPLLFFPLQLVRNDTHWNLVNEKDSGPFLNKAFLLAYQQAYSQSFTQEENPFDDFPKDTIGFLNKLYELVKKNFALNFSQELYSNELKPFPVSSKVQDEEQLVSGKIQLKPYAVFGQFSQQASFLIQDYETLLAKDLETDLESFLEVQFGTEQKNEVREDQLYTVFPMDGSQELVVKAVRSGQSCVVQGPPGTGKSQLISNLAIDYISRGKKVLLVSQKRAALDVVFQRLAKGGFGDFIALVHDFRADRKALFSKLKAQLDKLEEYKALNRSIDSIQLERKFSQVCRTIENYTSYFEDYRHALYDAEKFGIPVKEIYLHPFKPTLKLDLHEYAIRFKSESLAIFIKHFRNFFDFQKDLSRTHNFWQMRLPMDSFGYGAKDKINTFIKEIQQFKITMSGATKIGEDKVKVLSEVYFGDEQQLLNLFKILLHTGVWEQSTKLKEVPLREIDTPWLEEKFSIVKSLLSEEGVEWHTADGDVQDLIDDVIAYQNRKTGWLYSLKLPWITKRFKRVKDLLHKNHLSKDDFGVNALLKKLENRLNFIHQYTLLQSKSWLVLPKLPIDFADFNHFGKLNLEAIRIRQTLDHYPVLCEQLNHIPSELHVIKAIKEIKLHAVAFWNQLSNWQVYFSREQLRLLLFKVESEGFDTLSKELDEVFESLVALDKLISDLSKADRKLMFELYDNHKEMDHQTLEMAIVDAIYLAWLDEIEKTHPVLREVSLPKFEADRKLFESSVFEKWDLAKPIALLRLREQTLYDLEHNRLGNLVTYRDLKHQVSKKRQLWSIKKLMENLAEEVLRIAPFWMVSPETVSAIFPLEQQFDLVIFDEASQCFVENGLPPMLRGKQVVIAGDSQQLQPSDLYKNRLEDEEDLMELETTSLLELGSSYFPSYSLKGHYRSAQIQLVQFSNSHFYAGKLTMLPDRKILNKKVNPFAIRKVNGVWDQQRNKDEALEVVYVVKEIQRTHPEFTIGVITFNFFQMELIWDWLLDDAGINMTNVTVKNIENVQGDEYDWVVFSTGYGKNASGKFISNFGLLSKRGGINRLNVAVSRARQRITLVTSLLTTDFKPSQIENDGVRMLHDYIAFVEKMSRGDMPDLEEETNSGFKGRWYLKDKLEKDIVNVEPYRYSEWMDLAKVEEGSYSLAILTDDQRLFGALNSKEAFVYHSQELQAKNWPVKFMYSRNYWKGLYSEESQKLLE